MPSALDLKFDSVRDAVTGPGGRIQLGTDSAGRTIVANLPPTLGGLFDAFCAFHGEKEAVVANDERLSFAQLKHEADALASALAGGFGIGKGDRVAIAMRNCPAWIATYMAVVKTGAIAVLINGWWETGEMRHGLELTLPKLIIADAARAKRIDSTGLWLPTVVLAVERPIGEALAPLLERGQTAGPLPDVTPDDDATILFTSGSTGAAKGAVSTHRAVTSAVYAYAIGLMTLLGIMESEGRPPVRQPKTLINVPLFHVTGEVPVLLNSFVIGRSMVLMAKWDAGEALRLIEQEKVTYFVGVPTMSLEMMQHPDRTKYDLSSLTDIAAGGAPRPIAHVRRLEDSFANAKPALGYGLTETNAVGCSNFWSNYSEKPASTGRPQKPLVEVAILDDSGRHLPAGESGEIAIRSAANIRGYWGDDRASAEAFTADGYLRTGDVGYLDSDDYLFIVDRKKDIIIRGGENISCHEVEAALYGHISVSEACVFGLADDRLGEVPAAVVYSEEDGTLTEEQMRGFLKDKLAPYKHPAFIWFEDEPLPKLGTGKIDKVALRQRFAKEVAQES